MSNLGIAQSSITGRGGSSGGGSSNNSLAVNQTSHGFSVGNAIYFNGTSWAKAEANSSTTLGTGVVTVVADVNNFTVFFEGYVTGLSGFTPGNYYFVSDTTPGLLTSVEPSANTSFSNPLFFAITTSTGVVLPFRPSQIIGSTGNTLGVTLFTKTYYTTAQRALGTVYQNTTGQPIIVQGWMVGGGSTLTAVSDSSATPTTVILEQDTSGGFGTNFTFMVASNNYYELTASGGTAVSWTELKINNGSVTFSGELSGSRALTTVYQNTSGFAKLVVADLSGVGAGTVIQVLSDTSATPTTVVWQSAGVVTGKQTIFFMVPNNHYYEVTASGAAVAHWNEYTLPFNAVKTGDYATAPVIRKLITGTLQTTGIQANTGTGRDMFLTVSVTPSTTGSLIASASFCDPPGLTPYDNTTMSNNNSQQSAASLFVQIGEFYSVRQDSGSPALNHWWEYALG
jgi:hypothetical protein